MTEIAKPEPIVTPTAIADLFKEILLGRNVAVEAAPFPAGGHEPTAVAVYESTQGNIAGVCLCDIGLVHYAGAALCLIPAGSRLKAAELDWALADNFHEVLNICAQLFAGPDERRIRLRSALFGKDVRASQTEDLIAALPWRLDVTVSIAGYGTGHMSVLHPALE